MNPIRILLVGSSGYIGTQFAHQLHKNNIYFKTLKHTDCKKDILLKILKEDRISHLINCAAFVGKPNIEACETKKDLCIEGNIILPIFLKDICEDENITYCHISTGCLYNGKSNSEKGFSEEDQPNCNFENNNCGFYTGTKAFAEKAIKNYYKSYIWRIRLPFENIHNERNYISKILNYDNLITEYNSLSNKQEFVNACIQSILKNIPYGIYNITNTGYISAEDIVKKIQKTINKDKKALYLSMDQFYNTISKMPRSNCITNNSKLLSMGIHMSDVNESIDWCLKNWRWA